MKHLHALVKFLINKATLRCAVSGPLFYDVDSPVAANVRHAPGKLLHSLGSSCSVACLEGVLCHVLLPLRMLEKTLQRVLRCPEFRLDKLLNAF
jgi:hypothetical protein